MGIDAKQKMAKGDKRGKNDLVVGVNMWCVYVCVCVTERQTQAERERERERERESLDSCFPNMHELRH